ncbi:MAG: hypothetical protein HZB98_15695 [Bacteroidia bacterium]|nr:hypothetical protein [Bacteroidia bacterium]
MMIANLKLEVRNLVTNYDIDGLGIKISDHSMELVENMTVESMLLKPYLVNFVVWSGDNEYESANACSNKGIVDLIIPDNKIDRKPDTPYKGLANLHINLKRIDPEQAIRLDLSPLFPVNPGGRKILLGKGNKSLITDADGCISFISIKTDTINLVSETGSLNITTSDWVVPYTYSVGSDGRTVRKTPMFLNLTCYVKPLILQKYG